jgi:hypothetical protein
LSWRPLPASFIPVQPEGTAMDAAPVHHARGGDQVDGNLDGFGVSFNHAAHEGRPAQGACAQCL